MELLVLKYFKLEDLVVDSMGNFCCAYFSLTNLVQFEN